MDGTHSYLTRVSSSYSISLSRLPHLCKPLVLHATIYGTFCQIIFEVALQCSHLTAYKKDKSFINHHPLMIRLFCFCFFYFVFFVRSLFVCSKEVLNCKIFRASLLFFLSDFLSSIFLFLHVYYIHCIMFCSSRKTQQIFKWWK